MKNRKIYYVFIVMIFIIVLMIINVLRYNYLSIDKSIQGVTWYRYNYINGLYETLYFKDGKIKYFKPTSLNNTNSLDNCTSYSFNKKTNTLKLNCNKEIRIVSYDKDYLSLDFDRKNEKFFTNIDDSLNYEFEVYNQKSITDYKKEKSQVTEISKINEKKLIEVLKDNDEYLEFCYNNDFLTSRMCKRYTAEIIYRFIIDDLTFEESHTGLEDVKIEKEILAFCLKEKPEIDGRLWKD